MEILGHIDADVAAAIGVPMGPIMLLNGIAGAKGFGALHIETTPSRMKQIKGIGYSNLTAFVSDVANKWTRITRGDRGRLILVYPKSGYDLRIIIMHQVSTDTSSYWSVVTAIPARVERGEILFSR